MPYASAKSQPELAGIKSFKSVAALLESSHKTGRSKEPSALEAIPTIWPLSFIPVAKEVTNSSLRGASSVALLLLLEKPDRVPPARIVDSEQEWLKHIRRAATTDRLHTQPHLGSILHRWGQFNSNDYSEVQHYFTAFCTRFDPLLILRHFPLGVSLDGLDKIVVDPELTKLALS